jgi:hypothetical protein
LSRLAVERELKLRQPEILMMISSDLEGVVNVTNVG